MRRHKHTTLDDELYTAAELQGAGLKKRPIGFGRSHIYEDNNFLYFADPKENTATKNPSYHIWYQTSKEGMNL